MSDNQKKFKFKKTNSLQIVIGIYKNYYFNRRVIMFRLKNIDFCNTSNLMKLIDNCEQQIIIRESRVH